MLPGRRSFLIDLGQAIWTQKRSKSSMLRGARWAHRQQELPRQGARRPSTIGPARSMLPSPAQELRVAFRARPRNARSLALTSLDHTCRDHRPDFSATLTTTAFDRSSLRWFGISDLIAESEGPSFISSTVTWRRLDRRYS